MALTLVLRLHWYYTGSKGKPVALRPGLAALGRFPVQPSPLLMHWPSLKCLSLLPLEPSDSHRSLQLAQVSQVSL